MNEAPAPAAPAAGTPAPNAPVAGQPTPPAAPQGQQAVTPPAGGNIAAPQPIKFAIDDKGVFGEKWHESELLPEGLRGNKSLAMHKDITTLAKSYVEAQTLRGKPIESLIELPAEDATPEQRQAFLERIGVPKTADEYLQAVKLPEVLGKDYKPDPAFLDAARQAGVTPQGMQFVMDSYGALVNNLQAQTAKAQEQALVETEAALRKDPAFGRDFTHSMKLAQAGLTDFETANGLQHDSPEMQEFITQLRANPIGLKLLAHYGKQFQESPLHMGESTTRMSLTEQVTSLTAKMAKMTPQDPLYAQTKAQWEQATKAQFEQGRR